MSARILIIDDEPAVCRVVSSVLGSIGMTPETLTDSAVADTVLQAEKFDAVFVDARMPEPCGVELVRRMRSRGYNQNTPVVMMTGDPQPALLAQAFEAGTNYFLFKPVDRRKLQRILRASQFTIERERRRYQRVAVELPAHAECRDQRIACRTLDLSMGGALLEGDDVFPLGSRLRMEIQLRPNTPAFRACGYVVRLMEINRMGLQFEGLESEEAERLQEFLLPYYFPEEEEVAAD